MVGATRVAPDGPWPRALDRFYEGVVVPRALDDLPEHRFQEVLVACDGRSDPTAGVTGPAQADRASDR